MEASLCTSVSYLSLFPLFSVISCCSAASSSLRIDFIGGGTFRPRPACAWNSSIQSFAVSQLCIIALTVQEELLCR